LGASPAQVALWLNGQGIDEASAQRVDLLGFVMSSLLRLYSPAIAVLWFSSFNPHLGDRRPGDLLRSGRCGELLDAIAQERAGSFA
jgi:hypothetical protein